MMSIPMTFHDANNRFAIGRYRFGRDRNMANGMGDAGCWRNYGGHAVQGRCNRDEPADG